MEILVAVVGDLGVGKTALVKAAFPGIADRIKNGVAPPVMIPGNQISNLISQGVPVLDTSWERDEEFASTAIQQSSVIVVVVNSRVDPASQEPGSLERVKSFWLPTIRRLRPGNPCPVFVLASQIDLVPAKDRKKVVDKMHKTVDDFMKSFLEVEVFASANCTSGESAHHLSRAISLKLYPTAPLFCLRYLRLKNQALGPLRYCFDQLDQDKDGVLNLKEFVNFQKIMIPRDNPMAAAQMAQQQQPGTKEAKALLVPLSQEFPQGFSGTTCNLIGFLILVHQATKQNNASSVWALLRHFGFDETLNLTGKSLGFKLSRTATTALQLSDAGYNFFYEKLSAADVNADGNISEDELRKLCSRCNPPDTNLVFYPRNADGDINVKALLGMLSPQHDESLRQAALSALAMGYPKSKLRSLFELVPVADVFRRRTLTLMVFGCPNLGKSEFVAAMSGATPQVDSIRDVMALFDASDDDDGSVIACAHECPFAITSQMLENMGDFVERLPPLDGAIVLWDPRRPESLRSTLWDIQSYLSHFASKVPLVYVAISRPESPDAAPVAERPLFADGSAASILPVSDQDALSERLTKTAVQLPKRFEQVVGSFAVCDPVIPGYTPLVKTVASLEHKSARDIGRFLVQKLRA